MHERLKANKTTKQTKNINSKNKFNAIFVAVHFKNGEIGSNKVNLR